MNARAPFQQSILDLEIQACGDIELFTARTSGTYRLHVQVLRVRYLRRHLSLSV